MDTKLIPIQNFHTARQQIPERKEKKKNIYIYTPYIYKLNLPKSMAATVTLSTVRSIFCRA